MKQAQRQDTAQKRSEEQMPTNRQAGERAAPAGRATTKGWRRPPSRPHNDRLRRSGQAIALRRLMSGVAVGELVRPPVRAVRPATKLEDLATLFANNRASAVAVLDDDGAFRGVVTRDAVQQRAPLTHQRPCWGPDCPLPRQTTSVWSKRSEEPALAELTAADLMLPEKGTVGADTPLGLVAAVMVFSEMEQVPVVQGTDEAYLGLLTLGDVVRWLAETSGYLR